VRTPRFPLSAVLDRYSDPPRARRQVRARFGGWGKGDRREFRAVTGGVLHASGGTQDNVVHFDYEKVANRIYKIKVPKLSVGEYGFLAPGAVASANAASQGKIYTFQIVE
jgi:hypothetical protein